MPGRWREKPCAPTPRRISADHIRPIGVEKPPARFVDAFIGMGTEEIALGLQQVGRQPGTAETVIVSQRGTEGGDGNDIGHGQRTHLTLVGLEVVKLILEK